MNEKQYAVDTFQNNPEVRLFVGNTLAAGVGITLTASDTVVFAETGFDLALIRQCVDRSNRLGQKSDSVNAVIIVADDSIESKVIDKLDTKMQIMDNIVDGIQVEQQNMLSYLWDTYKKENK
jgi:SNF2 family DNA or RNA helicase